MEPIVDWKTLAVRVERRKTPRAVVCTNAMIVGRSEPPTEHVSYDLSVGGIRLCGTPAAGIGDDVRVLLRLGGGWVRTEGRIVRLNANGLRPEFAIRFTDLDASAEDAIHDTVAEALAEPERRSLLLVRAAKDEPTRNWDWLEPVTPRCATARTTLDAVEWMARERIELGLFAEAKPGLHCWGTVFPEIRWRVIDATGRLQAIAAP